MEYIYIYIYICTRTHMYVCMYVCTYECMYVRTYVRTYVCMHVCVYVCTVRPQPGVSHGLKLILIWPEYQNKNLFLFIVYDTIVISVHDKL